MGLQGSPFAVEMNIIGMQVLMCGHECTQIVNQEFVGEQSIPALSHSAHGCAGWSTGLSIFSHESGACPD